MASLVSVRQLLLIQAEGTTRDALLQDAEHIARISVNPIIKLPANELGFDVGGELFKKNMTIAFTAVYSASQGIMGGLAGAHFVIKPDVLEACLRDGLTSTPIRESADSTTLAFRPKFLDSKN